VSWKFTEVNFPKRRKIVLPQHGSLQRVED